MSAQPISLAELAAHQSARLRVSAVVLAAGLSARLGGGKMLLDTGGMPLIRRTVENVLALAPEETVVVTGHRAAEVETVLAGLPVHCVHNSRYREGQPLSVAAGVQALSAPCSAVMVVLGDQPLVTAGRLRELLMAYARLGRESILVPHHAGKRGNPIVFAARHIPAVIGGGLNVGCRHMIETHGDDVARIEFESDVFTTDCDTQEDYRRLLERLKEKP